MFHQNGHLLEKNQHLLYKMFPYLPHLPWDMLRQSNWLRLATCGLRYKQDWQGEATSLTSRVFFPGGKEYVCIIIDDFLSMSVVKKDYL